MRRAFAVLALSFVASDAWALGVGSTAGVGVGGFFGFDSFGGYSGSVGGFAPTLDLHTDPVHLQFHVLELTSALINDQALFIGANVYFDAAAMPVGGPWTGVVQPGFGLDLYGSPVTVAITAECRLGPQMWESAGFGVYVVPAIGMALDDGDAFWLAGGTLQLSAWFGS